MFEPVQLKTILPDMAGLIRSGLQGMQLLAPSSFNSYTDGTLVDIDVFHFSLPSRESGKVYDPQKADWPYVVVGFTGYDTKTRRASLLIEFGVFNPDSNSLHDDFFSLYLAIVRSIAGKQLTGAIIHTDHSLEEVSDPREPYLSVGGFKVECELKRQCVQK